MQALRAWSKYHCGPPRKLSPLTKGKITLMPFFAASDSTRSKRCRAASLYTPTCAWPAKHGRVEVGRLLARSSGHTEMAVRLLNVWTHRGLDGITCWGGRAVCKAPETDEVDPC